MAQRSPGQEHTSPANGSAHKRASTIRVPAQSSHAEHEDGRAAGGFDIEDKNQHGDRGFAARGDGRDVEDGTEVEIDDQDVMREKREMVMMPPAMQQLAA
ncbi:uncharacterized protein ColSpa_08678 [Colletotrichum spaethianum]|uniref:Uncharacterized protein n=1 Tax=Colletotrichum spaethianum TaxID=700344 RepID=A0AA37UQC2_9PEZI|nr:uncharacterized protein ColSpa_08678 [Colletotrichum spaethianum]GKT48497.1 hypothetical protein ColSpa_08678 [Colletotrichum spaethianum]